MIVSATELDSEDVLETVLDCDSVSATVIGSTRVG